MTVSKPWVARLLVDVQLEILVVVHETPTDLVDGQMKWILKENMMEEGLFKLGEMDFPPPGRPSGSNHDG